jgi:glycosyltransferase involved in cell wall biosynthesis
VVRGGERLLHELSGAMARRGHDVTVFSTSSNPSDTVEDGVRIVRLPSPPGEGFDQELRFGRSLFRRLLVGRYDAVHSLGIPDATASIVAAFAHPRRRTVFTHLGIPDRGFYETQPDWRYQQFVAKHIRVYGCMSQHAARKLHEGFGRTAALTAGGVHLERFRPTRTRSRQPTLLYAGALTEPRKHVDDLLSAVALIAREEPLVRLRLVGPGDPRKLIDAAPAAARERTEVFAPGTVDLCDTYSEAWATVLPSVSEAFGIVLIESLACGTPIVVSNDAAGPQLATPGVGVLVQPQDPAALADACLRALALARESDIRQRCRAAAEPYDWDTGVAPAVEALYYRGVPARPHAVLGLRPDH